MTQSPVHIFEQLGLSLDDANATSLCWGAYGWQNYVTKNPKPIFPRLNNEEEIKYIKQEMAKAKPKKSTRSEQKQTNSEITIDDFAKVQLQVAEILAVAQVKGSNKLLAFTLDLGEKEPRQILSGIAAFYPKPQELVGKKVLAVTNLKPRKMLGQLSQGMLLSSEKNGVVKLVIVSNEHENGALLG